MTPPIGTAPSDPVDPAVYRACADTMQDEMPALVGDFLESTENLLAQLAIAEAALDAPSVKLHAHSIKSSSAVLGAITLSELAAALEALAAAGQNADVADYVLAMRREFARVRGELSRLGGGACEPL